MTKTILAYNHSNMMASIFNGQNNQKTIDLFYSNLYNITDDKKNKEKQTLWIQNY